MKRKSLLTLAFLLASFALFAQVNSAPMPLPVPQFFSALGQPLSGGKIYTYAAGTTTPLATYTDGTGMVQNLNPIILNSGGFPVDAAGNIVGIWLGPQKYKVILQNSIGVQQWLIDQVGGNNLFSLANLNLAESTPPSCNIGSDILWGDSAEHRFKMCNNNGSPDAVVGRDTIDSLTNKTLITATLTNPIVVSPTVSGTETHTGTENHTGTVTSCQENGVLYVGGTCAVFWGGGDIGAQINAAYASAFGNPSVHISVLGSGNNFSTPIVLATPGEYVLLECLAPASHSTACLNYTPTSATAAIRLDYGSNSANPPTGHGFENVTLVNNGCFDVTGGCGSSATGIQIGNTNGGDWNATYDRTTIYGFAVGYANSNGLAVNQNWTNFAFTSNALAFKYGAGVTVKFTDCSIAGNGQILQSTAGAAPEIYMMNCNTFTNTGGGPAFDFTLSTLTGAGPAFFQCIQCHLEGSSSVANSHYISGVVNVQLKGGVMEDANPTGTGDWMISTGGTDLSIEGTRILSSRAYTNVILVNSPTRVDPAVPINGSPSVLTDAMLFGGAGIVNTSGGWVTAKSSNVPSPRQFEYPFLFIETIPTPGAPRTGSEACYSDSTTHKLMCSYNNGSYFAVTQTIGSGTSTSNGTAIASGVSQAQPAITVTGATTTDTAVCSLNAAPVATWQTGIQLLPAVVTANTVTPWLSNPTAGSITPAATVIRCTVTR